MWLHAPSRSAVLKFNFSNKLEKKSLSTLFEKLPVHNIPDNYYYRLTN